MRKEYIYKKVFQFQNQLLQLRFHKDDLIFSERVCMLIDETLGYKHSITGKTISQESRSIDASTCIMRNLSFEFTQGFLEQTWKMEGSINRAGNILIFSELPMFEKTSLNRKFLKTNGMTDCMLCYIPDSYSKKQVFFALFLKDRLFNQEDKEIIEMVSESIMYAEADYLKMWNLINQSNMLINYTNHFPIGIMIIQNLNQVVFTNEIAKRYLKDLGVSSPKMYGMFFTNKLYKYCKYELLNYSAMEPIRIKNYLFSMFSIGNPAKNLEEPASFFKGGFQEETSPYEAITDSLDASFCIYIINDGINRLHLSKSGLEKAGLTSREMDVAELVIAGDSNQEIADMLSISNNTVRVHISNLFQKMNVRNRVQLIDRLLALDE